MIRPITKQVNYMNYVRQIMPALIAGAWLTLRIFFFDFIAPRYFGSFRINEQDQATKVAGGMLRLDYAGDAAFKAYCLMKSMLTTMLLTWPIRMNIALSKVIRCPPTYLPLVCVKEIKFCARRLMPD